MNIRVLRIRRFLFPAGAAFALWLGVAGEPTLAWTPASQEFIAEMGARLAPPDLYRQIARNRDAYLMGAGAPFDDRQPAGHVKTPEGDGRLDEMIILAVGNAIRAIETHRPFNEIVYRLGLVAHFLADANNPLNTAESDPREAGYAADFRAYLESTEPRVEVIFYGFRPGFRGRRDLPQLIREALGRGRRLYPLVGREYRRIGFAAGAGSFDDRSTAYAVAALSFSHAVSDIAEVLRYIWLEAGGIDTRRRVPTRGREIIHLPR
ncbi:MAG: hypothetical protein GY856_45890 [bacterium]|nr:hypothetical protein [bacterium]